MHSKGTIVEGVGDELVYAVTCLIAICAPLIYLGIMWHRNRNEQTIHPESEDNVSDARERLRITLRMRNAEGDTQTEGAPPPEAPPQRRERGDDRELTCPICIGNAQFAVETNCGHLFCGNCMITYWRHGRWMGAVRCPVCRQTVTIMLFSFSEEEQRIRSPQRDEVMNEINAYNRRFSGEPRQLMDVLRDLPTLLRHCLSEVFSVGGLVLMFRMRVLICFAAALLYFISPLDIIPEAAFGLLGFLDDFFILLLLSIYISIIYRRFVAERA